MASADAATKLYSERDEKSEALVLVRLLYPSIILLPLAFSSFHPSFMNTRFILSMILSIPIEIVATVLYVKAITVSPLSTTVPMLSFTPLFLILTSYIMLGEKIPALGALGILLVVSGAYTLHLERPSLAYPFKAMAKEKGPLLMLTVAFIYSMTSNLGKICIEASSPVFFAATYLPALTLFYAALLVVKKVDVKEILKPNKGRIIIGGFIALSFFFHTQALNSAFVSYAIAAKRTSLLFAMIYGRVLFNEGRLKEKLTSGALMLTGVFLISLCK